MRGIFLESTDNKDSIFENYDEYLGKRVLMEVERPIGFKHVTGVIYKLNYGFIPNTVGGDGEDIDVYILDVVEPIKEKTMLDVYIKGAIIRYDDCDDIETKYVATLDPTLNYTKDEIRNLTNFMECRFKTVIIN